MLEVRGLQVSYGGIAALKGIDFDVAEGEVVALIGANGAGKSTTLRALSALVRVQAGSVSFRGRRIDRLPAYAIVRLGICHVPEGRGVFPRLTVHENLEMGAYARRDGEIPADLRQVYALMPRLGERRRQLAGTLSGGEQQMLAVGRAIMSRPALLLLDEPSMGLAPLMVGKIFETIGAIAREGVTILLVEQNARLALQFSRRAYVLESGQITLAGQSAQLLHDPRVRAAYLGE
jgi:branched-chain amino acid transport system ATP-binding protein